MKTNKNEESKGIVIQNNVLTGVKWDTEAMESVRIVAQGLLNLTNLFISQNLHIELIKVQSGDNSGKEMWENKSFSSVGVSLSGKEIGKTQ